MKRILLIILLLLFSIISLSQDVIYDPVIGDTLKWMKVKNNETTTLSLFFENEKTLRTSKMLRATGFMYGLKEELDYVMHHYNRDTLMYEFNSDQNLNLIVYRYYYSDSVFCYFVGLRKATLGEDKTKGKYLIIIPVNSSPIPVTINVYKGIGNLKTLFTSITLSNLNDSSLRDYDLATDKISIETLNGSRSLLRSIVTQRFILNGFNFLENSSTIIKIE